MAPPVPVPRKDAVQVGLIADLEGVDEPPPDSGEQSATLSGGEGSPPGSQVDTEDQPGPGGAGHRLCGAHPPGSERVIEAGRRDHPPERPPGPVRTVATDAYDRRLTGDQALEQLDEDGIDGQRIAAGVLVQRAVLERDADEATAHGVAGGGRSDAGCHRAGP